MNIAERYTRPDDKLALRRLEKETVKKMQQTIALMEISNSLQEELLELLKALQSPHPSLTRAYERLRAQDRKCQKKYESA